MIYCKNIAFYIFITFLWLLKYIYVNICIGFGKINISPFSIIARWKKNLIKKKQY